MAEHEYEVAVSFVAADEPLAAELSKALAGRLKTFVYSERQRELTGKDGVAEFSRVFKRDAKFVVVLCRDSWGHTPWTRVESTAIQERGFVEGWDFVIVVMLDESGPPDWFPQIRLWYDYARFGSGGLAAVLEDRVKGLGAAPRVETAVERVARVKRERDKDGERRRLLHSNAGVQLAETEVTSLFEEIQRIADQVRLQSFDVHVDQQRSEYLWIFHASHTVTVHWWRQFMNTLDPSGLVLIHHRGRVGPSIYSNITPARELYRETFSFNVEIGAQPVSFWEASGEKAHRFSTQGMAEEIMNRVIDAGGERKQSSLR